MQVIKRTPLYFAEQGHKVTFMVHSETTAKPSIVEDLHPNVRILRFDLPLKWLGRVHRIQRLRQLMLFSCYCLLHALRTYGGTRKPSVIYAAECDAVLIGSLLQRLFRVPLVTRFYGLARIAAHFAPERHKLEKIGLHHLSSRIALTRKANMVIVTNDGSRGFELVRALNANDVGIRFWKNGVEKKKVPPSAILQLRDSLGLKTEDFVLLTLCRLDPMKRVDRAVRAIHYLRKRGVRNGKLLVVGHGPERQSLQELAAALQVEDSVIFAGPVEHNLVYEYYALADVFLSLYDLSNVGNPLWEAINAGRCIVTLNTGATGEVIKDGQNGRLLEVGDDENDLAIRLAAVIEQLYRNPDLRSALAAEALAYGKQHLWTWDERLKAELDSILELVAGFRGGAAGSL